MLLQLWVISLEKIFCFGLVILENGLSKLTHQTKETDMNDLELWQLEAMELGLTEEEYLKKFPVKERIEAVLNQ